MPPKRKAPAAKKAPAGGKKAKKEPPAPTDVKSALAAASKKEVIKKAKPDKYFPYNTTSEVVDDYDCMLNQTNIGKNNNKYYVIQVLKLNGQEKYYAWFRWGRVVRLVDGRCWG